MGLTSKLTGVFKSSDEAAKAADNVADDVSGSAEDWFNSESASNPKDVDVSADGSWTDNMSANKRIAHDLSARAVEQPSRAVGGVTNSIESVTKVGVGGAAAAYTGGKVVDYATKQSRSKAYQALQARLTAIENNDNLSKEQKKAAKQRARQAFREAWGGNDGGGGGASPLAGVLKFLGMADKAGKGSGVFGGIVGKLILGGAIIAAIFAGPKLITAVKGGGA